MRTDIAGTADEIFRHRVVAARSLDRGAKFLAGPRLFERACVMASAGLRHRHPAADEAAIRTLLHRQIALLRRLESRR
jgi:hypothetical protein